MRVQQSNSLLPAVERGRLLQITVDGKQIEAYEGETIAAAMIAAGIYTFRHTRKNKDPRSVYCGMGSCMECLVTVNGMPSMRACETFVAEGMQIETGMDN